MLEIKKRQGERTERLLRRFNRNVQQCGVLALAREKRYREPELSRREKRLLAIRKKQIRAMRRKKREGY